MSSPDRETSRAGIKRAFRRGTFEERGRWAQEEREQARLDRIALYGEKIGNAYSDLVNPAYVSDDESAEGPIDRRSEVMAQALDQAIQSQDPAERLQGIRAIVDLTQKIPHHNHPDGRIR